MMRIIKLSDMLGKLTLEHPGLASFPVSLRTASSRGNSTDRQLFRRGQNRRHLQKIVHQHRSLIAAVVAADRRHQMGEFVDKVKGNVNEAIGKAKRAAGEALDRPGIKAEGDAQEAKGDLQKAKGTVKGAVKDVVDKA